MPTEHIVKDGEYLSSIAADYGFANYRTIWDHSQNSALKAKRKNPNVLSPGDVLIIPDQEPKECPAITEKRHRFELNRSPLDLRIIVKDETDEPIANTKFKLTVEGNTYDVTSDGNGLLVQKIPPTAHGGSLLLQVDGIPNEITVPLKIGFLHPVEEIMGIHARLNNLGYDAGEVGDPAVIRLRSAIEEFQCDHGLTPDGNCSPSLQAKLKEVHGC